MNIDGLDNLLVFDVLLFGNNYLFVFILVEIIFVEGFSVLLV